MSEFGFSFSRGELTVGNRIFTAFTNITSSQPTEEGDPGMGASPYPLTRDEGSMGLGTFEIEWSDIGQRNECIQMLAELSGTDGYRNRIFELSYVMTAQGRVPQHYVLEGCRFLDEPDEASQGSLIGGGSSGTFMRKSINGYYPHGENS